jgi:hypothetical protein
VTGGPKIPLSTIQDGGGHHIGFCFNCNKLGTVQPFALKFGVRLQGDDAHVTGGPKISLSIIQYGCDCHLGFLLYLL